MTAPLDRGALAERIITRSMARSQEVVGSDPFFDGDEMWMSGGTRGQARAYYAIETGVPFTRVRVVSQWLRVDEGPIVDLAHDLAAEGAHPDTIAYTFEGDGWLTTGCPRGIPGAFRCWHCIPSSLPG